MFDCDAFDAVVHAHLDHELDAGRESDLAQHLEICAVCRERLDVERSYDAALRTRLRAVERAPASLQAAIRGALAAARPAPWYARGLASSWAPRLAMAAVLAVVLLIPAVRLLQRVPDVAHAAGARHACHHLEAAGPVPPCCKDLGIGVGGSLGEPSPGVAVPDLASHGLQWARTTRCNFHQADANLLVYRDAAGGSFSLVLAAYDPASFRLIRWRGEDGVPVAHYLVPVDDPAHGVRESLDVTLWRSGNLACTWTGPAGDPQNRGAQRALHAVLH